MRAVAVLEWTGEEGHPKASRLVPVSLYDGQDLQDAGIYLARPAPLALSSEVEYELKQNGKTVGLYDIDNAGQEQGSWVGFGVWKPLAKPKLAVQAAKPADVDSWGGDVQSDRPVLHRKHGSNDTSGTSTDDSGSSTQTQDPDRPTLHKKASSESSGDAGAASSSPASDPDRPTLHKKTAAIRMQLAQPPAPPRTLTVHAAQKGHDRQRSDSSTASSSPAPIPIGLRCTRKRPTAILPAVTLLPAIPIAQRSRRRTARSRRTWAMWSRCRTSSDPDRPHLLRGKPAGEGLKVLPTLMGLPADMHQAVAVSDAKSRPEHLWGYSWSNPDDEAKMKAELEDLARKALGMTPPPAKPAPRRTATATHAKAKPARPRRLRRRCSTSSSGSSNSPMDPARPWCSPPIPTALAPSKSL